MGFKEDADFARYVSMGAIASNAVRKDLANAGHQIIELERYALANKVWQTKVKRLRLPDLVCSLCGTRVESRGKSKLGIVLSHSDTEGREWHAGGMRDTDLYAFLYVGDGGRTGSPLYLARADLRSTEHLAKVSGRKAMSEGAEVTLRWPAWVPTRSGEFVSIDTKDRLVFHWDDGTQYRYWQWKQWDSGWLYVSEGDFVKENENVVAGVVPPPATIKCEASWNLGKSIWGADAGERYAAVKVAGALGKADLDSDLRHVVDSDDDWRIRLEAMASLARLDPSTWTDRIASIAMSKDESAEVRMESLFVLSEIPTEEAADSLAATAALDAQGLSEIRSAAVWGLGQGATGRADLVLPYVADADDLVALHAIAGIPSLTDGQMLELVEWLNLGGRRAAAAAQILLRFRAVEELLLAVHEGGEARLWALRALGDIPADSVRADGGPLLTAEIEAALEPLWIAEGDWLRGHGAPGLEALDVQKVRFDPTAI